MTRIIDNDYDEKRALAYDEKRKKHKLWQAEILAVEKLLNSAEAEETILDAPIGTGRFIHLYENKKMNITGIDISQDMLNIAKTKTKANIDLSIKNILELREGQYDWTICIRLLNRLDASNMKSAIRALASMTKKKCILGIRHTSQPDIASLKTITHTTHDVEQIFNEVGFVAAERITLDKHGYHMYLLYKCEPLPQKINFDTSHGVHLISYSTAGKSTFVKNNRGIYKNFTLFDMDDLMHSKQWIGRNETLQKLVKENPSKVCCVLSNAHKNPLPLSPGNYMCVLPSYRIFLRNQLGRKAWATSVNKRPSSAKLENVLQWRLDLIEWVQKAKLPVAQTFEQALDSIQ